MEARLNQSRDPWYTLGHPKRRQIIKLLLQGSLTTTQLCQHFEVSRYAVMKHLNILEEDGVVRVRREGRQRWNELDNQALVKLSAALVDDKDAPWLGPLMSSLTSAESRPVVVKAVRKLPGNAHFVFEALTQAVESWWIGREEGARVVLEPWPNGRFFEELDCDGHGNLLGTVVCVRPVTDLWLDGPLFVQPTPMYSQARLSLDDDGTQTTVNVHHTLFGPDQDRLAEDSRQGWEMLLDELNRYLSTTGRGQAESSVARDVANE